jgi:hypothetical protein
LMVDGGVFASAGAATSAHENSATAADFKALE